jgi:arylsulfatase A-like enzyme
MTNILLVSFDTTRADRLGCYGGLRPTSPTIDRIAQAGVRFADHFSPHIPTYPGHTTLFTGRDLFGHGITCQSGVYQPAPDVRMLAEILQEAGYFTAAADNLNRWFSRGFDLYEGYHWETEKKHAWRRGEAVAETSLRVLRAAKESGRPFFLFLHFWDPHTPYLPPEPFHRMFYTGNERDPANRSMDALWQFEPFRDYFAEWMGGVTDIEFPKAQYDAEIAYMDACFAHVVAELDRLGLRDDTLVALTADHGEELDEHSHWFDHHSLYDTNLHIPLIMRLPTRLPAGHVVNGFTRSMDVAPTILDVLGLPIEPGMTGRSLLPLAEEGSGVSRGATDVIHATENTWMKKRALRTHTWKLIVPLEIPDLHGNSDVELYDLVDDPGEMRNVAVQRPEVVAELRARMDSWVARRCEETGRPDPLTEQPIALRRIGTAPRPVQPPKDESTPGGDFIGYDRKPEG